MDYCSSTEIRGNALECSTDYSDITNPGSYIIGIIKEQSHVEEFNTISGNYEEAIVECWVHNIDLSGLKLNCSLVIGDSYMNDTIPPVEKIVINGFNKCRMGVWIECLKYIKNFSGLVNTCFQLGDVVNLEVLALIPDSRNIKIITDDGQNVYLSRMPNIGGICVKEVYVDASFKGVGKMLACFGEIEKLVIPVDVFPKIPKQTRIKKLKIIENMWHSNKLDLSPLSYRDDITELIIKHSGITPTGYIYDNTTLVSIIDKGPMYQYLGDMLKHNKKIQDRKRTKYTKLAI